MLSVEQRLARLESSVRRWRVASVVLAGLFCLVAADDGKFPNMEKLTGDVFADTVSCRSFGVVGSDGNFACMIGTDDKTGYLRVSGKQGSTTLYSGLDGILVQKPDGTKTLIK